MPKFKVDENLPTEAAELVGKLWIVDETSVRVRG